MHVQYTSYIVTTEALLGIITAYNYIGSIYTCDHWTYAWNCIMISVDEIPFTRLRIIIFAELLPHGIRFCNPSRR